MLARTLTAIALLSLATACSSGGGGGGDTGGRVTPPGTFKPASCDEDEVGASAIYANVGKVAYDKADFDKTYNRLDLEAVFDASILSTAIYGSQIKADIYSVPGDDGGRKCLSYSFLPEVTEELGAIWKEAGGNLTGDEGTLQGLYFQKSGPKVLVLRGTDRWTLVHELMHYNFDKTRNDRGADTRGTLEARIARAQRAFEKSMAAYQHLPNHKDLNEAAQALDTMIRSVYQRNVDSFLEEVAIESLLIERYFEGRLKNVDESSAKSGVWYIGQSKDKALADFQDYLPLLDRVEQLANEHVWPDIAEKMQADRAFVASIATRIDAIVAKAKSRLNEPEPANETEPTPLPGPGTGEEIILAASVAPKHTHALDAHTAIYTNSPEYKMNKRGIRRLVEKYK